jgi:uncharacterized phage-associated protein
MVDSHSAEQIALVFVKKAKDEGASLTHKKLQKLLYYAQAWNLVFNDEKLFKEEIQAWVHGPVVAELYEKYKGLGANPFVINDDVSQPTLNEKEQSVIDSVWRVYGKFDGDYLEMLTHNEQPWIDARAGLESLEPSQTEITPKVMKEYYERKLKKHE